MLNPFTMGMQALALSVDAHRVIELRTTKLMQGDAQAYDEAVEMVREKIIAFSEMGISIAFGTSPEAALSTLHEVVAANISRLQAVN